LQGAIFRHHDGSIKFMGHVLAPEEAREHISKHVWENRKKLNKQIKKWRIVGPDLVNCGC
jgi:hypothetical protein